MAIDLSRIDKEIQRLTDIKRLLSDPESFALVEELIKNNTNGATPTEASPACVALVAHPNGGESYSDAIRRTLPVMPNDFTTNILGDALRQAGIDIDNAAVGKALAYLERKGEVEVT